MCHRIGSITRSDKENWDKNIRERYQCRRVNGFCTSWNVGRFYQILVPPKLSVLDQVMDGINMVHHVHEISSDGSMGELYSETTCCMSDIDADMDSDSLQGSDISSDDNDTDVMEEHDKELSGLIKQIRDPIASNS